MNNTKKSAVFPTLLPLNYATNIKGMQFEVVSERSNVQCYSCFSWHKTIWITLCYCTQLYGIVVRVPDFDPRGPRFETQVWRIFHDLGKVSVLDDGAGRRKGVLAVYTPPGRTCTVECCVCNIRAPLIRNSTWAFGMQTGYSEPQRALWTMSNRQVLPLVINNKQYVIAT
jgi:hypothetical protein